VSPATVECDDEVDGLGHIVADLLTDNLQGGTRDRLLMGRPWGAEINVHDAQSVFVVELGGGKAAVRVRSEAPAALRIRTDGDTLIAIPEVPLVAGLPDPRAGSGRVLLAKLLRRELRIGGLLRHPMLLRRLLRLLTTARQQNESDTGGNS